jgi:hypothetical protein
MRTKTTGLDNVDIAADSQESSFSQVAQVITAGYAREWNVKTTLVKLDKGRKREGGVLRKLEGQEKVF